LLLHFCSVSVALTQSCLPDIVSFDGLVCILSTDRFMERQMEDEV
jgi:hypothetical protein